MTKSLPPQTQNALMRAAYEGSLEEFLSPLIPLKEEHAQDWVSFKNANGYTVAHVAAERGHHEIVAAALRYAPEMVYEETNKGETIEVIGRRQGFKKVVDAATEVKARLDFKTSAGPKKRGGKPGVKLAPRHHA